jgi:hypothetical protein
MKLMIAIAAFAALGTTAFPRDANVAHGRVQLRAEVVRMNGNTGETTPQPLAGVRADKSSYALGQAVKINFVIENRTNQEMAIRFPSGQHYDIWVQKDGKEIWRWSRGKFFIQAFTSLTLKPGERKTFAETWKQVTNEGKQVPPGAYDIFAQLTTVPSRPTPVKTQVTVGTGKPVIKQVTVRVIVENVDAAVGQLVSLSGVYRGWRPDPEAPACRPGPPVSRSDWAVSDQTGCIFVTGRSGLDPTNDYGKRITVVGVVRKTSKGQPYIEARSITVAQQ